MPPNPALLKEIDNLVRVLVPRFLELVGLKDDSNKLRLLPAITTKPAVIDVCKILNRISESSIIDVNNSGFDHSIKEVTFWAESSVWMAVSGFELECFQSVRFARLSLDEILSKFTIH